MQQQITSSTRISKSYNNTITDNTSTFTNMVVTLGGMHSVILKGDGKIIVFGHNNHGQCNTYQLDR